MYHILQLLLIAAFAFSAKSTAIGQELQRAIDPNQYEKNFDLAAAYLEAGNVDKSRAAVQELLKTRDTAELHNLLAHVESAAEHITAAAHEFEVAARMDESERNLFDLGTYLVSHNGTEQARVVFGYAVKKYPQSARLRVGLGITHYSAGEYDEALRSVCEAVDLDPADTKALDFLGKMRDVSPKYSEKVKQQLAGFVQRYPTNAAASYYFALAIQDEQPAQAERYLKRSLETQPDFPEAHFALGQLYQNHKQIASAIEEYESAVRGKPSMEKAHYRLAVLYKSTGENRKAALEFQKVEELKKAPTNAPPRQ